MAGILGSYVRLNESSAVYRVAKLNGDQARCIPAPERVDGATTDRVWWPIAKLIHVAPATRVKLRWKHINTWDRIHEAKVPGGAYIVRPVFDTLYEARVKCYTVTWWPEGEDAEELGTIRFDVRHFAAHQPSYVQGERFFGDAKRVAHNHYAGRVNP